MWQVIVWAKFCEILIERSMCLQLTPLVSVRNSAPLIFPKSICSEFAKYSKLRELIFLSGTGGAASENSALVYY